MEDWLIISSLVKYRQNKNQQSEHAYVIYCQSIIYKYVMFSVLCAYQSLEGAASELIFKNTATD